MSTLKTEIIYYNGATDFEFEFNLNAICPMRLFTACPSKEKELLSSLSLAVSRSRVTFITAIFDNQLIESVAHAIGFKTETIVPDEYGITQSVADKIITGGVPLITSAGVYGGIILESGPQSLIILTNERVLRKQLMSELVKGYISDIAALPTEPTIVKEEKEEVEEEAATEQTETEIKETVKEISKKVVEPEEVITEGNTETIIQEEIFDYEPVKKHNKAKNIFTAILTIILFILLAFIIYSLVIEPILNNVSILDNLKHIFGFLLI